MREREAFSNAPKGHASACGATGLCPKLALTPDSQVRDDGAPKRRSASTRAQRASFVVIVQTLVFDDAGRLLLLRRRNTGLLDGWFSLPGGHRDAGESVAKAAVRECAEEACVTVERLDPVVAMPYADGVDFVFEATRWSGTPGIGEPDKCDALTFAPLDDLPAPTTRFVKAALECRRNGVWYQEFE